MIPDARVGLFISVNGEAGLPAVFAVETAFFDRYFPDESATRPSAAEAAPAPEEELRSIRRRRLLGRQSALEYMAPAVYAAGCRNRRRAATTRKRTSQCQRR
jgi:hypothetical protein